MITRETVWCETPAWRATSRIVAAFAEFLSVPAKLVHRLPDGTDPAAAAVLEPAACVAQGLLEVDLRPGLAVAVVGAGALGVLAVALSRLSTPSRLALVGTRPRRLDLGRRLGATEVHDVRGGAPPAALVAAFDLVIEAAGTPSAVATALRLAWRGGAVVLLGISGGPGGADADAIVLSHLRVQGAFGASRSAWLWVVDLLAGRLLDTRALVSHSFPLARHADAFATHGDREAGALKVQLTPA